MNLAELPESLVALNALDPVSGKEHLKKYISNCDRVDLCALLVKYVTETPDANKLVDELSKLVDQARIDGYALPQE